MRESDFAPNRHDQVAVHRELTEAELRRGDDGVLDLFRIDDE